MRCANRCKSMSPKTVTHETPKFVKAMVAGWPVYAAVGVFLLAFSELWIDRKVDSRIIAHAAVPTQHHIDIDAAIAANTAKLGALESGQLRIEAQLAVITAHLLDQSD